MPVKLSISSNRPQATAETSERHFDKDIVTIGRRDFNDIQLHDQHRLVSGHHAEIRKKDNLFILVDMGSKNGTQLNGQRIDTRKEYPLKEDDQIIIGEFVIKLQTIEGAAVEEAPWQRRIDSSALTADISEDVEELTANLSEIYWEYSHADAEVRKRRMAEAVQRIVDKHDEADAGKILDLIEALFPEPQYQNEKVLQSFTNHTVERRPEEEEYELYRTAYQGILKIAGRYIDKPDGLRSAAEVTQLIDRIDRTLEVMIDCLGAAIKGRRKFEQEFDVEATRIFSWKLNPVKMVEDNREIGRYLIDWRRGDTIDKVSADLSDAFTDLALHQMGLMAGFKECLRGILKQLDPTVLEAESREKSLEVGHLKIPGRFGPLVSIDAWNRFKKKHRELLEEEVKTFETILGPHFAKGYLSIQEKKKAT